MTDTLSVLAQLFPAGATSPVDIYDVPTGGGVLGVTVSSICCCNQSKTQAAQIRISVAPGGAPDDPSQYLVYDKIMQPRETFAPVIGITMAPGDAMRVQCDTGTVSFSVFGVQITP